MNAHTRFALPVNTHANLKLLHDKAQANADDTTGKTDNQVAEVTVTKQQRRASKFSQKMKMLFPVLDRKVLLQIRVRGCNANNRVNALLPL
ncbi:hypothetical protein PC116_g21414 [Phytophthora cactorum]|uniref:Uncharacterized protein n=1 Tax=Phytophthora cactorum TaxID=29920 RepID=A0A8T1JZ00_9STRA|nr:hypothetical protein PC112_g14822 [Phytophthora cactorum]KAG2814966.1 hypothetical protein PC111_g13753 [Phytophthora cactorum]KAG2849920.1 hypothetical protein PC113_g17258 [Phytophthora cactorum]KAG2887419.1 hypothetical protein PC114_g18835 [Phytophthora cactorum]KAG2899211.1 hypothetical protein PC115_g16598 [Phytophthora cactorum]